MTDYMRVYMRHRYHERRKEMLRLLGGRCASCGTELELEIDHIDRRTKTMEPAHMTKVGDVRMLHELEKCQLLCRLCHVDKSRRCGDFGRRSTPE